MASENSIVLSEGWQYAVAVAQIVGACAVVLGVIVAIVAIISNARTAKKSQTARFLFESKSDLGFLEGHKAIRKIHESHQSFNKYAKGDDLTNDEAEDRRSIHYFLNFFERAAISIQHKTYDEAMLKKTLYSAAVKNYDIVEPFIKALREKFNSQTYYQEYEWLAKRWQKEPLKKKDR
ncbi:DUF4760 domain-containing protein [Xenorhabdus bovienii]|uniref:DUF4760 domain-containing protein n=1 Tax=Xenorhabdus bovienii TaxID=40576 RepID=UPI0023B2E652|nr:DUF4760 domain-containing protein [Xenorhabdus bovienii]MDE9527880.1 DUF4760 domain-containing protein [Xenorhabdus bovienii]